MAAYKIEFLPTAARELASLPKDAQQRIARRIDLLADDPRPAGVRAIQGSRGLLRLRVGDYRIVYRVEDDILVVLVVKVGHRRDVYRRA
ncbi:MAG: type II toxin-antitoxin system RelE family toxin [Chloroflexota bacterium]